MQNYKIIMNCKKKMLIILIIPEMPIIPIINFGKVLNLAKVYTAKMTYRSFRKISEKFGREEGGFLMKKGY